MGPNFEVKGEVGTQLIYFYFKQIGSQLWGKEQSWDPVYVKLENSALRKLGPNFEEKGEVGAQFIYFGFKQIGSQLWGKGQSWDPVYVKL